MDKTKYWNFNYPSNNFIAEFEACFFLIFIDFFQIEIIAKEAMTEHIHNEIECDGIENTDE